MEEEPTPPGPADRRAGKRLGGVLALAALTACLSALPAAGEGEGAGIRNRALGFEALPGATNQRITLKPGMIETLGIETGPVREAELPPAALGAQALPAAAKAGLEAPLPAAAGKQKAVPSGAVVYDAKGAAWVYVRRQPGVFEGQRVRVAGVAGDLAFLSDGPPVGTAVVTVGATILSGAGVFGR